MHGLLACAVRESRILLGTAFQRVRRLRLFGTIGGAKRQEVEGKRWCDLAFASLVNSIQELTGMKRR